MTRREALAAERAAESRRGRRAAEPEPQRPRAEHVAPRKNATGFAGRKFVPSAQPKPAQPTVARAPRPRRLASQIFTVVAMAIVAAVTVVLSTPAEALMSSADVQAKQIAAATKASADGQVILAGGGATTVSGESYSAETRSAYASESGFSQIENTFTNDPNGTVQWPFAVGVHIGDLYGSTSGRASAHHGLDFNPGIGAPIQAIADGVVTFAEDGEGDLGVHLMITHQINGQTITSVYAHMLHGSMRFKVGDVVKVGQVLGNVGDTGYSTGPHLHFEIRLGGISGAWTDPLVWLRANTN